MSNYTYIDYKGQRGNKKPRVRMLTSCMWWSKDSEYNIQYETESEKNGREMYFNDECDGVAYVNTKDEGIEFEFVRDAKPELRKTLSKVMVL